MTVVGFKGSRGEDFITRFALKFSDFLIEATDKEESFFAKSDITTRVVMTVWIGAVFRFIAHGKRARCK